MPRCSHSCSHQVRHLAVTRCRSSNLTLEIMSNANEHWREFRDHCTVFETPTRPPIPHISLPLYQPAPCLCSPCRAGRSPAIAQGVAMTDSAKKPPADVTEQLVAVNAALDQVIPAKTAHNL